ncbi:hypothetical protein [Liquorilactobacillus vini]|uniref:Uncharacterized protein n=1 Tax=Liquorilactobacillus vini DSM 20605 TaxID=1133569 RepID=A0A0R2C715_9LACO|nr:hypothetical protein [Liquorilactobacillus vini]KRM84155.1 hypothetical protein FD21_GL002159 [Liquorilactobacillus vini DSM 20605]
MADESNIQKAFEKNGESFATANFIPAYFYHGSMTDSSAAIFFALLLGILIVTARFKLLANLESNKKALFNP